jgi:hypothetical protein
MGCGLSCGRRGTSVLAQGGIKTGTRGVAVYYPFALVALTEFTKSDDYEETGELLLIFEDADGAQVTLKIRESAIAAMLERLAQPPDD